MGPVLDSVSTALARLFVGLAYLARAVSVNSYRMACALEDGDPEARFWIAYVIGYALVLVLTR